MFVQEFGSFFFFRLFFLFFFFFLVMYITRFYEFLYSREFKERNVDRNLVSLIEYYNKYFTS